MLTSWSEVSTPAELSSASVLILRPGERRLDAAALGEAEVGALADHLGAQRPTASMRSGSLARSPASALALARGLHIGADAAEIEQVDRRLQDGAHQVDRRRRRLVDAQHRARLVRQRDRLGGAVEDAAARRDQASCRSPSTTSAAGRTAACARPSSSAGIGRGIDEDVAMVEGRQQPGLPSTAACRCRTRRPTCRRRRPTVNGVRWMSVPELAEVPLHRFPGAARGDAHLLVVVAGRAARGEGVVEPEAVVARQRVGDVGEGGGALVGGDHEIGIVAVVAHARWPAASIAARRRSCR